MLIVGSRLYKILYLKCPVLNRLRKLIKEDEYKELDRGIKYEIRLMLYM